MNLCSLLPVSNVFYYFGRNYIQRHDCINVNHFVSLQHKHHQMPNYMYNDDEVREQLRDTGVRIGKENA